MTQYSRSSSGGQNHGSRERPKHYDHSSSPEGKGRKRSKSRDRRRSRSYERRHQHQHRRSPYIKRYPDKLPASRKLFVTNIDGKYSEDDVKDDIRKQFGDFGQVKEIVVKTKQNSSNTYVFVQYEHLDDSIKAQEQMKGKIFKGKELKVQFGKGERRHEDRQSGQCYICHKDGHYARDCRYRRDDRYEGRRRSRSRERHHYHRRPRYSRSSSSSRRSYRRRRSHSRDYDRKKDYRREKEKDYYSRNY